MFLAWYEKEADEKNNVIFQKRSMVNTGTRNQISHFHHGVEMVFAIKGDFEACIGENIYRVQAGQFCFVPPFEPHKYYYSKGNEFYVVVVSAEYFSAVNGLDTHSFSSVNSSEPGFERIKEFLDISFKNWDEDSIAFKNGFVNTLVGMMRRYYPFFKRPVRQKNDEVLVDAVRYINENSRHDIGIEEISARFGYTPNYFSNIFNRFMGMSFRDYLNWCRLLSYTRLKQSQPDIPVAKAAELCGFGSANSFYRAQKKYGNINHIPTYLK